MRAIKFLLICFFIGLSTFAQPLQYKFDYLTIDDGLSSNRIWCIFRDNQDFLWFGTDAGLDRYNSLDITKFRYSENVKGSISSNYVTCIYQDKKNNLWFGSEDGLNLYDPKTETFTSYRHDPTNERSLNSERVNSIIEDTDGNLWVLTESNCLNLWDPDNQEFQHFKFMDEDFNLYAPKVDMIDIDSKGNFWIPSVKNEIIRFNPISKNIKKYVNQEIDSSAISYKCIYIDNNDKIWIGSEGNGFFSFDPINESFHTYPISENGTGVNRSYVRDIIPENDRYLLLAVDQGGINRFDKVNNTFEYIMSNNPQYHTGLNNDGIWRFHKDKENILWVGTSGGGVNYYNPNKKHFELFNVDKTNANTLTYNFTGCFYEDTSGEIWIGTDGGGISVYNPDNGIFKTFKHNPNDPNSISSNVIRSIDGDENNIWIGVWDSGLNRYDKSTGKFHRYMPDPDDPSSISGRTIWSLKIASDDIIWLGIHNIGIDLFHKEKGVIKRIRTDDKPGKSIKNSTILYFYEDEDQNMWITSNDGLFYYDLKNDSITWYDQFPDKTINAFYKDTKGNIWLGSTRKGLFLFDVKSGEIIAQYDENSGLSNNNVKGIIEDGKGNLWMSTDNGISEFNPTTENFRNFTKADGLQSNQFFIQSFYKSKNGKLFFGGYNGFNAFYPDSLKENDFIPPIIFTRFELFNKTVPIGDKGSPLKYHINTTSEIELSWKQSVLGFEFVGINYTNPEKNVYKYMLEGFDADWIQVNASRNFCTYTNLDPGEYTFHVKASNNEAIWDNEAKSVKIIISPPYWQTNWFRILVLVLIAGLVYLFFQLRIRQLKIYSVKLEQKVKERTLRLNELINELKEKQDEIETNNEELSSTLEEISAQKNHIEKINNELKDAHEELQQINEKLDLRVQERTQKLVKANRELDRFVYSTSHDLSAPLKSILGLINITRIENKDKSIQGHIDHMEKSVEKLEHVIKSLTQFSRNMGHEIKIEFFDFDKLLDEIILENDQRYKSDKVLFDKKYSPGIMIKTDPVRFKIIMNNLITNAIKYRKLNSDDSIISIGFVEQKDSYLIQIKDNGIGIEPDIKEKIFKMFYRGTEQSDGSGLGLYIVRETVQKLQGKIYIDSKPNEYTVVEIQLPK